VSAPIDVDGDPIELTLELSAKEGFSSSITTQKVPASSGVQAITIDTVRLDAGKRFFWRVTADDGSDDPEGGRVSVSSSFTMFKEEGNVGIAAGGGGLCASSLPGSSSSSSLLAVLLVVTGARVRRRR
jgi:hypothetical protein